MLPTNCSRWSVFVLDESSKVNVSMNDLDEDPVIITDAMKDDINIYVNLLLRGTIAVFGTSTNVINMIVFFRLGLKDSNSIGLMALSFTDFVVTFLGIAGTICFTLDTLIPDAEINPVDFEYVTVGWVRDIAYLISGWVMTLLSIERCVCVVAPFRVRDIFTRTRCIVVIAILYIVNIGVHMPVFLSQWLDWKVVECKAQNGTVMITEKMVLHVSSDRHEIQMYIDIANGAVLPIPSQALVLISVLWMIYGLHASVLVRSNLQSNENSKSKLSSKESRLVKVVLFLAIIFTVCNIPRFLAVYAKQIFQEVSLGRKYRNLYVFLWNISALAQIVNSSVNIFVYILVNSSYRQKLKELFGLGKESKEDLDSSGK